MSCGNASWDPIGSLEKRACAVRSIMTSIAWWPRSLRDQDTDRDDLHSRTGAEERAEGTRTGSSAGVKYQETQEFGIAFKPIGFCQEDI